MSATDNPERKTRPSTAGLDELPDFELSYLFDEQDEPGEVTIFPESNEYDISTNWITVDVHCAVRLDEVS